MHSPNKHRVASLIGVLAIGAVFALQLSSTAAQEVTFRPLLIELAEGVNGSSPEVAALLQQARALEALDSPSRRLDAIEPDEVVEGGPSCDGVTMPDLLVATLSSIGEDFLRQSPLVAEVEAEEEYTVNDTVREAPTAGRRVANDAQFAAQSPLPYGATHRELSLQQQYVGWRWWHLDRSDSRNSFQTAYDEQYQYDSRATGAGVDIYVIDSGLRTSHVDFRGRVSGGHCSLPWWFFCRTTDDCDGHGSHVAGLAMGTMSGIAKQAMVYPIRALNCKGNALGRSVVSGMLHARKTALRRRGRRAVVNISIGGPRSSIFNNYVRRLVQSGLTVVVSAGNKGKSACRRSPASSPYAITVGNVGPADRRVSSSNHGGCVDIWSTGGWVYSASIRGDEEYDVKVGTSMAAPVVAGMAARYLSEFPRATPQEVKEALACMATRNILSDLQANSPNLLAYYGTEPALAPGRFDPRTCVACVGGCSGNGDCVNGNCQCDCNHYGERCEHSISPITVHSRIYRRWFLRGYAQGRYIGSTVNRPSPVLRNHGGEMHFRFVRPIWSRRLVITTCAPYTNYDTRIVVFNQCLSGETEIRHAIENNDDQSPRCPFHRYASKVTLYNWRGLPRELNVVIAGWSSSSEGRFDMRWTYYR